jgi:NADPH:quinone reductase-like Zn-dependent oxidoreductase
MKAIVVRKFNDTLDQLVVSETGTPSPSTNEILIKIIAAGVNYVDTLYVLSSQANETEACF